MVTILKAFEHGNLELETSSVNPLNLGHRAFGTLHVQLVQIEWWTNDLMPTRQNLHLYYTKKAMNKKTSRFCGPQPRSDEYLWRAEMEINFLLIGLGK
jgi:hypothetical protein